MFDLPPVSPSPASMALAARLVATALRMAQVARPTTTTAVTMMAAQNSADTPWKTMAAAQTSATKMAPKMYLSTA